MPKKKTTAGAAKNKHQPQLAAPSQPGTQGLRSLKDRLSMIRFNLWRTKNQAVQVQPGAPGRTRGLHSLRQKLGSTLKGSYRFVMNRLAVLRHLHPNLRSKGTQPALAGSLMVVQRTMAAVAARAVGSARSESLLDVGQGQQRTTS